MKKSPHPLISLIPALVLIGLLVVSNYFFDNDTLSGGSQTALLISTGICLVLAMGIYKMPWKDYETTLAHTFSETSGSIVILLMIGMMAGAWMVSGVVPTFIYYGIQILSPSIFLVAAMVICAVVSLLTGSSWSTIATIGVALIGIGTVLRIPAGWSAGAIISGAYFGDKISPLSDTTILASTCTKTDLFTHIRYMLGTTVPTFLLTLVIFFIAGLMLSPEGGINVDMYMQGLSNTYHISAYSMIVPAITIWLIARKWPSLVVLFLSSILAGIVALLIQPEVLTAISHDGILQGNGIMEDRWKGLLMAFFTKTSVGTGNESLTSLVTTGGMRGMLDTIWLIMCALCFGSAMVASGMLESMMRAIIKGIRSTFSLVSSTVLTGIVMNLTTGDQYMSIILTSNLYRDVYQGKGYESRLLSRTVEDSTTVTSVLIPWNTCGMTQSTVLGVATLTYLPYCFFCLISPLMSMLVALLGWKIKVKKE